jgi:hypothetical protein
MTHIKYPNELGAPVPIEPNWQNEAMRQNALLHSAMMGSANAEARAIQLELERDALLRVVTDNHVALTRAEDAEAKLARLENDNHRWKVECEEFWREREEAAEAKLAKAVKALRSYVSKEKGVCNTADAVLDELEKTE